MSVDKPVVAIVGRPNVGKSTLFNRLLKKRKSIVHSEAGVTRDRIHDTVNWSGCQFILIDTGGYIPDDTDQINVAVKEQIGMAIEESDLLLFVVDGVETLTNIDHQVAEMIRKSGKNVILTVNKLDNEKLEIYLHDFYNLGLGKPYAISAMKGRRIGDYLDLILENLPREVLETDENPELLKLAIVGKPNAGKSSILNCLLGENKAIVTDIPGTTRDSIDTSIKYFGKTITLIDTAGLRKKSKVKDNIEYFSAVRSNIAISRSNISVLVIDGTEGFQKQDANICRAILNNKRGLLIVINKWDLVKKSTNTMKEYVDEMIYQSNTLKNYPVIFTSALTKKRVTQIMEKSQQIFENYQRKINTKELNDFFQKVIDRTPPPATYGKYIRIKYVSQVKSAPPLIVFFCNEPKLVTEEYKRFLENQFRSKYNFEGVPISIKFRKK